MADINAPVAWRYRWTGPAGPSKWKYVSREQDAYAPWAGEAREVQPLYAEPVPSTATEAD